MITPSQLSQTAFVSIDVEHPYEILKVVREANIINMMLTEDILILQFGRDTCWCVDYCTVPLRF